MLLFKFKSSSFALFLLLLCLHQSFNQNHNVHCTEISNVDENHHQQQQQQLDTERSPSNETGYFSGKFF